MKRGRLRPRRSCVRAPPAIIAASGVTVIAFIALAPLDATVAAEGSEVLEGYYRALHPRYPIELKDLQSLGETSFGDLKLIIQPLVEGSTGTDPALHLRRRGRSRSGGLGCGVSIPYATSSAPRKRSSLARRSPRPEISSSVRSRDSALFNPPPLAS